MGTDLNAFSSLSEIITIIKPRYFFRVARKTRVATNGKWLMDIAATFYTPPNPFIYGPF